ncbi:alpha-(1,3)-fucosyltransferase 7 [Anolis carolinensis]|uniref:alpha-(1,3)-fucosyltransferase 7 n=1 Tax=Anolis carolinensis TaxID=28377 RepID=UPI002F2B2BCB
MELSCGVAVLFFSLALASGDPLTVLVWEWPDGQTPDLSADVCSRLFGLEGCCLTTDRSLFNRAEVVVFHHRELGRSPLPPAKGHPGQSWTWVSLESPEHTKGNGSEAAWTWVMSYRRDADIFMPYGKLVPRPPGDGEVVIPPKSGLVVWVVSHFRRTQARAKAYYELSKHIQVDVFGRAAGQPLAPEELLPTISRYRFYLAFENALSRDYVTEKLWRNALQAGSVPVVLGPPRDNYEAFLPGGAFLHLHDFPSVRDLAHHLRHMPEDVYRGFFDWRQRHAVKTFQDWRERFCAICTHYPRLRQKGGSSAMGTTQSLPTEDHPARERQD